MLASISDHIHVLATLGYLHVLYVLYRCISAYMSFVTATVRLMEALRGKSYFIQPTRFQRSDVILGEGSYGVVYRGAYDHSQYALKYIRRYLFHSPSASTFSMNTFERECEFARQMADPNIVRFVGISYDEDVPILITELMECSLTDVLNCRYCSIPYYREVNIARGIARGLHYLHTRSTPVVHRDLSSNNILLAEDCTAKIADLGVAKCVGGSACTPMPGTTVYMPPEVTQHLELSVAIDLFSFGVLLVQIETRRFPEPADKVETIVRDKQSGEGVMEGEEGEVEGEGRGEEGDGGDQRGGAGEGEAEGKVGSSEQRRESQYERNDSQEKTQVWRTEIERRHSHLCLMDKMGVFHRMAMCYLQESAKVRRQTKLEEVAGWLEEATRAHNYTESVRTNPEVYTYMYTPKRELN